MNKEINLQTIKKAHLIGIGGIGVSAIARMMLLRGSKVSGSDNQASRITEELEKSGAKFFLGQRAENIPEDCDLVVYSPAVSNENPELSKARELSIPTLSYPEILGIISKTHYTIAVSGTHGKTTTTGMLAKVFMDGKYDPTVIIGSILRDEQSNFVAGFSDYFIVEACEYKRSFLNIWPTIGVITNIDNDHLDYFKDLKDIQSAFHAFAIRIPPSGFLICDATDEKIVPILKNLQCQVIDYAQLGHRMSKLGLRVPGEHNRKNAAIALAISDILKFDRDATVKSLLKFKGTWRRFEYKGEVKRPFGRPDAGGAIVYDDYAHHPTEIKATLQGAREMFPDKKISLVFQPHLYSRTRLLLSDFAESLSKADHIIVTDIYAAREKPDEAVSGSDLVAEIKKYNKNVLYIKSFEDIVKELKKNIIAKDLIITMGAGDIYKVGDSLLLS